MATRAPRYRYSFYPTVPGADRCGLSISIRRVDGDPDGGTPGLRTSSEGIDLDLLLSDLREVLGQLPAADDWHGAQPRPVREWFFDGLRGALVTREVKG